MNAAHVLCCQTCQWLDQSPRCKRHMLFMLDPADSVCHAFQNQALSAVLPIELDPDSLYLWIENPITHQRQLAALASFDFVRSWSIDQQRAMRAKRILLRQFFQQAQLG